MQPEKLCLDIIERLRYVVILHQILVKGIKAIGMDFGPNITPPPRGLFTPVVSNCLLSESD